MNYVNLCTFHCTHTFKVNERDGGTQIFEKDSALEGFPFHQVDLYGS